MPSKHNRDRQILLTEDERNFIRYLTIDRTKCLPHMARATSLDPERDGMHILARIDALRLKLGACGDG